MAYDVNAIRARFPALLEGAAHFDGPGGSQTPDVVADAVGNALRAAVSNRGTVTASEQRAEAIVTHARAAVGDLLGLPAGGVVFGRSMTQLTYELARALAKTWGPGDEVVVTRLDHDANIRPWVQAAEAAGATVRWAEFDPTTAVLSVDDVARVLSSRTRLVAVTAASNLVGSRPDVRGIADAAHDVGALVHVDGVHATPHGFVDAVVAGADFWACSPYKFLGPHLGVLAADPELLATIHPDKLAPMPDSVPERFEQGTLPYELLAGVTAAVDFLSNLVPTPGSRRVRLAVSMAALEAHEAALSRRLEAGLSGVRGVTLHGDPARVRTPTTLFSVAGLSPRAVHTELATFDVNAPGGTFYAIECARHLGLGDAGAVRAGIAPYTTAGDVDRLVAAVHNLSSEDS